MRYRFLSVSRTQYSAAMPHTVTTSPGANSSSSSASVSPTKAPYSSLSGSRPLSMNRILSSSRPSRTLSGSDAPAVWWTQCTGHGPPCSMKEQWLVGCQSRVKYTLSKRSFTELITGITPAAPGTVSVPLIKSFCRSTASRIFILVYMKMSVVYSPKASLTAGTASSFSQPKNWTSRVSKLPSGRRSRTGAV